MIQRYIRLLSLQLVFIMVLLTAACSPESASSEEGIKMPKASSYYEGRKYGDVVKQLKELGFTNITTEIFYDPDCDIISEGNVASVKIGDVLDFKKRDIFTGDEPIIVTYILSLRYRSYKGKIYDRAFYSSVKDGMRARYYSYYFFNETKHTVLYIGHGTAGAGRTHVKSGTYSGDLNTSASIVLDNNPSTIDFVNDRGVWSDGAYKYSEEALTRCISDVLKWR